MTNSCNLSEGKARAEQHDCKYIEVSAVLNHKVDDLLVGVLKQIRLTPERQKQNEKRKSKVKVREDDIGCLERARRNVLNKLLRGNKRMSKSCENLLTLWTPFVIHSTVSSASFAGCCFIWPIRLGAVVYMQITIGYFFLSHALLDSKGPRIDVHYSWNWPISLGLMFNVRRSKGICYLGCKIRC